MSTPSDSEKSFSFLYDNIPSWFNNLMEIEEKVTQMQNDISRVPVSRSPFPLKKKTGSIESIRDLDAILEAPSTSAAAEQNPYATLPRKRKTTSVISGQPSGPNKYRSRVMVIVYYDGQIQKQFETLVRSIGTGRNILRKGKMAARMEELSALAGSDDDSEDDEDDPIMAKIQYRHRAGLSAMRSRPSMRTGMGVMPTPATSSDLFDSIDKALEQAQALCERAAHQSLRDGDCKKELEGMRRHFQEVMEKSTKEVEKHNTRKEKEAEKAALEGTTEEKEESKAEEKPAPTPTPVKVEPKSLLPSISSHPTSTIPVSSKPMEIEIDDDDDESIEFTMPPIRFTSRT
jgi:hypothetical protein